MLPKPPPELSREEVAQIQEELQRKPSKEDLRIIAEARKVYSKHPLQCLCLFLSTNIDFDRLNTVILSKYQNLSDFCCRKEKYNVFLCEEALDYQEEKLGITYLWYYTDGLVAFVTLSTGGLRGRWIVSEDRPGLEVEYIPALGY